MTRLSSSAWCDMRNTYSNTVDRGRANAMDCGSMGCFDMDLPTKLRRLNHAVARFTITGGQFGKCFGGKRKRHAHDLGAIF